MNRWIWVGLVLMALGGTPAVASADIWLETEDGVCDRHWSASSLTRGPVGMANGITLPFRTLWGGFTDDLTAAALVPLSFGVSLAEASQLFTGGLLETASAGIFGLVPEAAATEVELDPVVRVPIRERSFPYASGGPCPPTRG